MCRSGRVGRLGALLISTMAGAAFGQADMNVSPTVPAGGVGAVVVRDASDPLARAYQEQQLRRVGLERELKKIRFTYFRSARNTDLRQAGIARLREFDDPAAFPALLEVFRDEGADVRGAVLDQLAEAATDEADATLAWTAVFDHDGAIRRGAAERLVARSAHGVSGRVKTVIGEGLRRSNETQIAAAADLADILNLYEAIPMMISAQAGGSGSGGGSGNGNGDGALAYILIAKQEAFVSDLTPVVGDSAVAFDPTLSVLTEGVYLRVIDASVITYRADVHNSLVRLSSRGWGRDTGPLGWDAPAWREWYAEEFVPHRRAVATREKDAAGGG